MPLLRRSFRRISNKRMFTRCMASVHVFYLGSLDFIRLNYILSTLFLIWITGVPYKLSWNFHNLIIQAHIEVYLNNSDKPIEYKWCHSFIHELFLIVNYHLLRSTFKKNIQSIDKWLVLNEMYFLYILSANVFTDFCLNAYISIHTIYMILVISFRMEECNNGIFHDTVMKTQRGCQKIINYIIYNIYKILPN